MDDVLLPGPTSWRDVRDDVDAASRIAQHLAERRVELATWLEEHFPADGPLERALDAERAVASISVSVWESWHRVRRREGRNRAVQVRPPVAS
jgi:hypothetical protein